MSQLSRIQIVVLPLAQSLMGYTTANRIRGIARSFLSYWRRLISLGLMVLFGLWLSMLATALFAQPYQEGVRNQLPRGVSALKPVSPYDAQRRDYERGNEVESLRSDSSTEPNNLSGTTKPFIRQTVDNALYLAIIERTPWKSEWRSDNGETCLQSAAKSFNLDPVLILAVIEQESNFNPDAQNRNDNESLDVGLMQINSQWHEFLAGVGIEEKHLMDPCVNTHVGAWILNLSINEVGDVWRGVGAYNAGTSITPGTERRRQAYTEAVAERFSALNQKLGRDGWDLASIDF